MTPEQRLDRAERIILMLAKAGYRTRREWREQLREQREQSREQNEKINILIQSQMEAEELIKRVVARQAELAESQRLTDQALRAFINSLRKGRNGKS